MKNILLISTLALGILFQGQQGKAEDVVCPELYSADITKQVGRFTFTAFQNSFTETSNHIIFIGAEIRGDSIFCSYGKSTVVFAVIPHGMTCTFKDGSKKCLSSDRSKCAVTCH